METLAIRASAEGKSENQPFLFSEQTIAELTAAEKRGEYTLARLRQLRPEVIDEIVHLRGEWAGMLRIAKICRVHHKTVAAVCAAYPEAIQEEQQKRVKRLRSAADKLVELVDDNPESVPANVRCLAASQLLDKASLLDGQATMRVEHVGYVDIYSDWEDYLANLESEAQKEVNARAGNPIDIEALNVAAEIDSNGQRKSAISEPPATTIAALPAPETTIDVRQNL